MFDLANEERILSPTKTPRSTTPRRVQIAKEPIHDADTIPSETESISTAIDAVEDDDNIQLNEHISESPVDNMFANLVMNGESSAVKKKSPRKTSPTAITKRISSSPLKSHHQHQTVSYISDEEKTKVEEVPDDMSTINYSEDFSSVTTETSTPRILPAENFRIERPSQYEEFRLNSNIQSFI